jgi:nicotinamidase-related amidase
MRVMHDAPTPWVRGCYPTDDYHADLQRVAGLIDQGGAGLSAISITLDAHHRLDIAHPSFWRQGDGSAVTPFTQIEAAQVRAGVYLPRDPQSLPRALAYLDALEAAGRYRLMVWPVHCEIGSWGAAVHADVRAAYNRWEERTLGVVTKLGKGSNPWTEHYSAVMAEVPDDDDPATQLNRGFIATLAQADTVYITGEAGSHCVRATTEHIAANLDAAGRARLVLVTDCMSPVAGFEAQYQDFLAAMSQAGVRLATSAQVLQELQANA